MLMADAKPFWSALYHSLTLVDTVPELMFMMLPPPCPRITAFMTVPQYSVYSASKRALLGFSLTARAELEKGLIIVSEIYPFITATNFGNDRMGIRRVAGRRPITPMETSPNSSLASFCKRSKKGRLSISRMIVFAKWPESWPRRWAAARAFAIRNTRILLAVSLRRAAGDIPSG
jgi:NAD(P)-dependent dehydrogenase (short-subunit alcohol dehydrogenase family)